ncbi:MAG: YlmC/YmxH family sporulation protein [Oscillospiraceae bacterium]|nr:YlmC/YmxH family sporulation protein [Oscillospiraceae bacterium]
MKCTLNDIRNKEIINIRTGSKLGYADDIEFDTSDMTVRSFVVGGRYRLFGLLGKDDDVIVKCRDIEIIGTDTILISIDETESSKKVIVERKSLCK